VTKIYEWLVSLRNYRFNNWLIDFTIQLSQHYYSRAKRSAQTNYRQQK